MIAESTLQAYAKALDGQRTERNGNTSTMEVIKVEDFGDEVINFDGSSWETGDKIIFAPNCEFVKVNGTFSGKAYTAYFAIVTLIRKGKESVERFYLSTLTKRHFEARQEGEEIVLTGNRPVNSGTACDLAKSLISYKEIARDLQGKTIEVKAVKPITVNNNSKLGTAKVYTFDLAQPAPAPAPATTNSRRNN